MEALAARIRTVVSEHATVSEKRMFGGIAFLADGHMFCGTAKGALMVRVGPEAYEWALAQPHVRVMDFTGKPMRGYVFVDAAGMRTRAQLQRWVKHALEFVATLPARPAKPRRLAVERKRTSRT